MDLGGDHGLAAGNGKATAAVMTFGRLDEAPRRTRIELAVDLGERIGSLRWWRGAATLVAMIVALVQLASVPPMRPSRPAPRPRIVLAPRIPPTVALPQIDRTLVLKPGERLERLLVRGGAPAADAEAAATLIRKAVPVLTEGTQIDMTLGSAGPAGGRLDRVSLRAAFDLTLTVRRDGGRLVLDAQSIAVDTAPLHVSGTVGTNLYRAAREAGIPPTVLVNYLHAIGQRMDIDEVARGDRFDVVMEQSLAATGERRIGRLLYGGLRHGRHVLQLMRWPLDGTEQWLDGDGAGAPREGLTLPVDGALTSGFGPRFHPILGYTRMHEGIDLAAPEGTPIVAAADGVVRFAGWHGGYGNYVLVDHARGMSTGYGHMSRVVVTPGEPVRQRELIGYVGSTGLSTGPHCHFEVFRDGVAIDPSGARLTTTPHVAAADLVRFKSALARYAALSAATVR